MNNITTAGVEWQHPKYTARLPQWTKCRDCFEGSDVVKSKGEIYLPALSGQEKDEYKRYKHRALFYGITSKSLQAIVGMAMSADLKVEYPELMKPYFEGDKFTQFSEIYSTCLQELMLQSRVGLFIDFSTSGSPYIVTYVAEDIINWSVDGDGNIDFVMLKEQYDRPNGSYGVEIATRYRELRIVKGAFVQTVHEDESESSIIEVTVAGRRLDFIPFYVLHPTGLGFVDTKPMMLDIAEINISHYMSSADLEHGRHFTGLPTPVIIGGEMDGALHIGSTKFLVIPHKQGDAKYLEFTGQGLQSLEKAMTEKQGLLASMSARLLDNSTRGSEAAEAVKLRYSSETASLKTVVKAVNQALSITYKKLAEFIREDADSVVIELGTDFMEAQLSASEMATLFEGYFKGAVSKNTLIYNMRKGRRLDPNVTDIEEMSNLINPIKEIQNVA